MTPIASPAAQGLVGDVGGTNARFALADAHGRLSSFATLACADFASLEAAVGAFLAKQSVAVDSAVLAVAGPVIDRAIEVTNLGWRTTERELAAACGLASARLCNDYAALAYAAPRLQPHDLHRVGGPAEAGRGSIVVLGPGTGFGAAALIRDGDAVAAAVGEAGHIAFAPTDDEEIEFLRRLSRRHGRVSIERILSGPGLQALHGVMCDMAGAPAALDDAAAITAAAEQGDGLARRTVERFCAILGSVAGDFALSFGARGGVQIAGGVAPRLLSVLEHGAFRARFEAKGRFTGYMRGVTTHVVLHPHAALLGAALLLRPRPGVAAQDPASAPPY